MRAFRQTGFILIAGLGLSFPLRGISQESLSDMPSFRDGCRALEDARYGTAAEHFLETWSTLETSGTGEVEKEFVTTRLLEAWVRNDDSETAVRWLEENPALNASTTRLRWMAIAFQKQLRFAEAAEIYGLLRGTPGEPDTSLALDHALCLAMVGDSETAKEILQTASAPTSPEEHLQAALIAGKVGDHEGALQWLQNTGESIRPMDRLHLTAWHLANLGQIKQATKAILDAYEVETDESLQTQKILLLNELEQLGNIEIPTERLEAWASQPESPLYEGAELFLAMNEADPGPRNRRLESWIERFPENPFSDHVRLMLDLPPAGSELDAASLDEFLREYKSARASRDYLAGLYTKARDEFLTLSESGSLENRNRSLFNAAIAALKKEDFEDFLVYESELQNRTPRSRKTADLTYLAGLFRAARAEPDALTYLETFIRENPDHPNRVEAQLALAEIHLNQAPARPQAARQIFESLGSQLLTLQQNERLDYTKVWLEIVDNNEPEFFKVSQTFLREWPGSNYFAEISMLLAKKLFEENRLEDANPIFARVATDFPDSPFSEIASVFAAKSTATGAEAILAWKTIAYGEGPYALEAMHELGLLFLEMDRFQEARDTLGEVASLTESDSDAHYSALADIGHAYYLEALALDQDEVLMSEAAASFSKLARLPEAPPEWKYSASLRRARCLESIGKDEVALEIYRSIVSSSEDPVLGSPLSEDVRTEEWVFRAGFFAIQILRDQKDWLAAIRMADDLSRKNGPRAIEAANLAEQLRLKHWVWD
ncbi:MAG: tetratricopeptide repeat protein [Verrucomicrobiota bacterium]